VPHLSIFYNQEQASVGCLLQFYIQSITKLWWETPGILYPFLLFYYDFSFLVAGGNRKREGSHLDGEDISLNVNAYEAPF
jgi:hypothetical protein